MRRKVSPIIIFLVFFGMVSVALAGSVDARTIISLDRFQTLAREQGRDLRFLDLSRSQAELALSIIKGKFGLSSDYDSKTMKQDMDALESYIDERLQAIKILKENIKKWEKEKEDPAADTTELEKQIGQANDEMTTYQSEVDEIRPAYVNLVLRYHNTKSLEDMAEPELKPYEKALDQLTDAQNIQPKLMDYNVERLYLTLLVCNRQEEMLESVLRLARRSLEIEELKLNLGMSTPLQVNAVKENVQQREIALQKVKNEIEEYSRNLLYLAGLPFDFKFQTVPVNFPREYQIAVDEAMPDFTTCVVYRSAYDDLQDAIEELEDTSEFDRKEYQLAKIKVEEAELELQKTLDGLEKNYLSSKERFHLAGSAVKNAALSLEQAQGYLRTATLQHELGIITSLDLDKATLACLQAEHDYFSALIQEELAYQAYLLAKEGIELPGLQ